MKQPRDLSGRELGQRLGKFGYLFERQDGSHMRFTSHFRGQPHHLTIPDHKTLLIGTLSQILRLASSYLGIEKSELLRQLLED